MMNMSPPPVPTSFEICEMQDTLHKFRQLRQYKEDLDQLETELMWAKGQKERDIQIEITLLKVIIEKIENHIADTVNKVIVGK